MPERHSAGVAGRAGLLGLLLLAAAAGQTGCRRSGPPLPREEFLRRAAAAAGERARLTSFSAEYSLSAEGARPGGRQGSLSCSGVILVQGSRLRMSGEKALGMARIFDLVLDGPEIRASLTRGNRFMMGRLARALEGRGAESLLAEDGGLDLARLLLPAPALGGPGGAELSFGRSQVEAVWRSPEDGRVLRRTVFAADSAEVLRSELLGADGRPVLSAEFDPPAECGGLHPVRGFRLRLARPAEMRLEIRFSGPEVNCPVRPKAFDLAAPEGAELVDLDKASPPAPGSGSGGGAGPRPAP